MSGDVHVQFCERLRGRFLRSTHLLIFTRSKSAAVNARKQATRYLEGKLKLTVNQQKTHIVHSKEGVKFLGVIIHTGFTGIQEEKILVYRPINSFT